MNYFLYKIFNFTYYFARKFKKKNSYPSKVFAAEKGNEKIKKLILSEKPFLVSRFGGTEINYSYPCVHKLRIPFKFRYSISNLSGVFPLERKVLDQFSKIYYDSIKDVDLLGIWNCSEFEGMAVFEQCPKAFLSELRGIEPYYFKNPWSKYLKKKKVLVISPFSKTIIDQFKKRDKLFKNPDVLPDFYLITYSCVQSIGGNPDFKNWTEALRKMRNDIDNIEFDIAIIGAGAYGLPLGAHIKRNGKQAIYMGGATQILFGIKGKRWENHEFISKLFNENWVYPSVHERPENYKKVEGGCYW
jgi:hypothetical protein